jgi:hypothetical protein
VATPTYGCGYALIIPDSSVKRNPIFLRARGGEPLALLPYGPGYGRDGRGKEGLGVRLESEIHRQKPILTKVWIRGITPIL